MCCFHIKDWETAGSSDMLAPVNKTKCHIPQDYSLDNRIQVKNIINMKEGGLKWDSKEYNMLHNTGHLIPSNVK